VCWRACKSGHQILQKTALELLHAPHMNGQPAGLCRQASDNLLDSTHHKAYRRVFSHLRPPRNLFRASVKRRAARMSNHITLKPAASISEVGDFRITAPNVQLGEVRSAAGLPAADLPCGSQRTRWWPALSHASHISSLGCQLCHTQGLAGPIAAKATRPRPAAPCPLRSWRPPTHSCCVACLPVPGPRVLEEGLPAFLLPRLRRAGAQDSRLQRGDGRAC
jgi:hypothetical protein